MARRTSAPKANLTVDDIDIDELITKLAKAIGKEVAAQLGTLPRSSGTQSWSSEDSTQISMDNSIIPMKVDTSKLESNIENIAKQEVKVDKDVEKNKSKLADLMKRKKKE
jgi:hypothetical protein